MTTENTLPEPDYVPSEDEIDPTAQEDADEDDDLYDEDQTDDAE